MASTSGEDACPSVAWSGTENKGEASSGSERILVPFNATAFLLDLLLIGLAVIWEVLFKLPFCGVMYGCGCTFAWGSVTRGIARCNFRNPVGPHCPWCVCNDGLGGWLYCWTFAPLFSVVLMVFSFSKVTGRPRITGAVKDVFMRVRFSAEATAAGVAWICFSRPHSVGPKRAAVGTTLSLCLWTCWALIVGVSFYLATDYPKFLLFKKPYVGTRKLAAFEVESSVFVNASWLVEHRRRFSVTVLDARDHARSTDGQVIRDSQPAPWRAFVSEVGSGFLLPDDWLRARLAALGVSSDRPVVVVGDWESGNGSEGRIFWMLHYLGHPHSYILYGGITDYQTIYGLEDTQGSADSVSVDPWQEPAIAETRAKKASIAQHRSQAHIIDARTSREYVGSRQGGVARPGHIAGAISWPWTRVFDGRALRPCNALRESWEVLGDLSHPIFVYSTAGVRSSFVWAVMRHCGLTHVANYDGSVWEWATDRAMPMNDGVDP